MKLVLRQEEERDYSGVFRLIKEAFKDEEYSDKSEHYLVERLRRGEAFVPELSIVAEADGELAGHILFTEIEVGGVTLLALAPVSVLPGYQGKGIGGRLIERGHEVARELGYRGVVLLGHAEYYPKFGYKRASVFGIKAPFEIGDEFFMAIELTEGALAGIEGTVRYPREFGIG